jgi:LuxR family maltose regulon positive regulatory protein
VLDRLLASEAPIIATVAPPGYGKTTLLAQWSERNQRPTAWVSLDEGDNDPVRLLGYIAAALDRVEPIDSAVLRSLASPGVVATSQVLPRLGSILSSRHASFSLVIDHLEAIHQQDCVDAIVELAAHLPVRSQLAVGSRDEPPLPMARLRADGQLIEVGVDDLAMDEADARALLLGADVAVGAAELTALVDRTEGWPVGLYLAALAMKSGGASRSVGLAFSGDHRLMADYLRSEVLSRLPLTVTEFLRRTSVLDRLSGPLCDAVLGSGRSQEMLESLERSNLLLVPLDRQRVWYRYHHLFRDLLRAELVRSEPELVPLLHDRAATWFEMNGLPDVAIDHVQAAGDASRAAYLCARFAQPTFTAGHVDTALRWLGWFEDRGLIEQYPQLAMLRALADAMLGRTAEIRRWTELAEAGSSEQRLPDGSPLAGWVAVLSACLCRRGVAQMREDAERACNQLAQGSPFQGPALFLQ